MDYLLGLSLVLNGAGLFGFLFYMHKRDEREDRRVEQSRLEIAQLNQARIEETSNLLQRIQAPEQAVVSHVGEQAPPDPPPVDLEDDKQMFAVYEDRMNALGLVPNGG